MPSQLLDTAPPASEAALVTTIFAVRARAEPGVMPRVLELFAKRGLVPQRWHSSVSSAETLTIDVQITGLGGGTADYVANCMRQIGGVEVVLTQEIRSVG